MTKLDWTLLSGPRVSRRTLMHFAMATGAFGLVNWLAACGGGDDDDDGDDEAAAPAAGEPTATTAPSTDEEPTATEADAGDEEEMEATEAPADEATEEEPTEAPAAEEGQQGGTLRLGFGISGIVTLDPGQLSQGVVAGSILPSLFSSLVQFDQDLGLVADLAEDWEVSEDGTEYTFHLREGLTFHNGDPLVADDVIYTYNRTTDEAFASPHANKLELIEEIDAPDDLTVTITLSEPFAPFLAVACTRGPGRALTPIPRNVIEEIGDEQFGLTPVGSGPFRLVEGTREVGEGFEMEAFEDWYGGRPLLDRIVVSLIPETSSIVSALEAGDVDFIDPVPTSAVEQMRANSDVTVVESPGTSWRGLVMNYDRPPWDNPDARMAVSKALDRNDFVERAFFGLAVPSVGAIAPAFGWVYRPPEEVDNPQDYDIEEARSLAESAGLSGTQAVAISTDYLNRPTEVLRTALQEIGVEIEIEQLQAAAFSERWQSGAYDMFIHGSVVDADPDDGHWNIFHSEGPWNTYNYQSDEADELLAATRATSDQEERKQLFWELQTVLERDVAAAFLYHTLDFVAFHNSVQGFVAIPEQRYYEGVSIAQ